MKKQLFNNLSVFVFTLLSFHAFAQTVPRKVVAEYFTNTWCSICASRNPGFYNNLNSHNQTFHITYHPSSPFSGCILSQHNVSGNNGRTQHYGVFGSTPRLVIQGNVVASSTNYGMASLFTSQQNQSSDFKIEMTQTKFGTDSMNVQVNVIRLNPMNTLSQADLYVCLVEDTIFYTGPNGESLHYRVFRSALTANGGVRFNISDTVDFSFSTSTISPVWNFSRIQAAAILQQTSNKQVIQAEMLNASGIGSVTGIRSNDRQVDAGLSLFPNPSKGKVTVNKKHSSGGALSIYYSSGALLRSWNWPQGDEPMVIDLSEFESGLYMLVFESERSFTTKSLIVN